MLMKEKKILEMKQKQYVRPSVKSFFILSAVFFRHESSSPHFKDAVSFVRGSMAARQCPRPPLPLPDAPFILRDLLISFCGSPDFLCIVFLLSPSACRSSTQS